MTDMMRTVITERTGLLSNLLNSVVNASYLLHWAEEGQKKLIKDFSGVEARARERGFSFSDPVVFKLENKGGIFCAVEMTGSGYIHPLLSP